MPPKGKKGTGWANAKGPIVLFVGLLLVAGIAGGGIWLKSGQVDVDRESGCPKDGSPDLTVVLIDLTDPLAPIQIAALRNAVAKVRDLVPKYGRLVLYPLKSTKDSVLTPIFNACSPGARGEVVSELYGNKELAERIWQKQFASKLETVLTELNDMPPQQASPILEGIQSVAVTALAGEMAKNARTRRVVIISDMIHHTPELSMYKGAPQFSAFGKSQYFARIKPDLRNADVDIYLIVRDTMRNVQQPPLYKFWVEFLAAGEGYLKTWQPLQ